MRFPYKVRCEAVTVKVYCTVKKSTGYRSYWLAWHEGGQRKRETRTGLDDALDRAKQIAAELAKGRPLAADVTAEEVEVFRAALEAIKPTGKSLSTVISEYMDSYHLRQFTPRTVAEIVDSYRVVKEDPSAKTSAFYKADIKYRLKRFLRKFGKRSIHDIRTKEVLDWIREQKTRGDNRPWSARTRKNIFGLLRTIWSFAVHENNLPAGAHALSGKIPREWLIRSDKVSLMANEDLWVLLERLDSHKYREQLIPFVVLQAFGGLRVAEAKRIAWEDMHVEDSQVAAIYVDSTKAKTRSKRVVDVPPALASYLLEFKVLRQLTGPVAKLKKIDYILHREAKRYGLEWKHNQLRHTCATHLLRLTNDPTRVAYALGTSETILMRNYREVERLATLDTAKRWFATYTEVPAHVYDEFANTQTEVPAKPPALTPTEEYMLAPFFEKRGRHLTANA